MLSKKYEVKKGSNVNFVKLIKKEEKELKMKAYEKKVRKANKARIPHYKRNTADLDQYDLLDFPVYFQLPTFKELKNIIFGYVQEINPELFRYHKDNQLERYKKQKTRSKMTRFFDPKQNKINRKLLAKLNQLRDKRVIIESKLRK